VEFVDQQTVTGIGTKLPRSFLRKSRKIKICFNLLFEVRETPAANEGKKTPGPAGCHREAWGKREF